MGSCVSEPGSEGYPRIGGKTLLESRRIVAQPALHSSLLPFAALLASEASDFLRLDEPMWLSRAPGRLNLLGGPGEAPGTAALTVPISRSVYTAIQMRTDRKIRIRSLLPESWGGERIWEGDIDVLYTKKGPPRSFAVLKQIFSEPSDLWMMRVLAVMLGLRRTRQLNTPKQGFDLVIWSRIPEGIGYGERAAFGVSLALALKGSTGLAKKRVDGVLVARAVVQGFREVLDDHIPLGDALTSSIGRANCALQIEHGVDLGLHWIPIPPQCSAAVVDLGYPDRIPMETREIPRIAAKMGLAHLNKVFSENDEPEVGSWGQVAPTDFENGVKDHVPASEKAADWLQKFRRKADCKETAALVNPDSSYRLRASAEHECRESGRVRRMVSNLNDYTRSTRETFLAEAGRCMGSSQRSLKEKCGLKLEPVDDFVKEFNASGRSGGMFGARMAQLGGCSVLGVLVHQSARQDLRTMVEEYNAKQKDWAAPRVIFGSQDGGVLRGWWEGVLEPKSDEKEISADAGSKAETKAGS